MYGVGSLMTAGEFAVLTAFGGVSVFIDASEGTVSRDDAAVFG